MRRFVPLALGLLLPVIVTTSSAAQAPADEWHVNIAPYFMGAAMFPKRVGLPTITPAHSRKSVSLA